MLALFTSAAIHLAVAQKGRAEMAMETKKDEIIVNEPVKDPQSGKWYQFTDHRIDGKLLSRECKELGKREA